MCTFQIKAHTSHICNPCTYKRVHIRLLILLGWTAIHEASSGGFTEVISELLKAGADVNSRSMDGILPIHDAVSSNHFEVI